MNERTGEAYELDEQLTVLGAKLQQGDPAPDFSLDSFDGNAMSTIGLADTAGQVRLLNVVNSLDTPVCNIETRKWDRLRADLPPNTVVYTVSMDLPYAQARWQNTEGVSHTALSAHKNEQFGADYGVLIKEWRLLQRAVFVIGPDGLITYAEYVPDQMKEPNYKAAVEAVRQATRA
ncbi:MAG TPA: thiol peroxidase [Chloroflexia bacterium]|nr:thiol peroxidase [Chloroflexia bacterium]